MKSNGSRTDQFQEALKLMQSDLSDDFIDEFRVSLGTAIEKAKGAFRAHVESVVALSEPEKQKLRELIKQLFKRDLELRFTITPRLLGGLKIKVGDWKVDASLLNQLNHMRESVQKGELNG